MKRVKFNAGSHVTRHRLKYIYIYLRPLHCYSSVFRRCTFFQLEGNYLTRQLFWKANVSCKAAIIIIIIIFFFWGGGGHILTGNYDML